MSRLIGFKFGKFGTVGFGTSGGRLLGVFTDLVVFPLRFDEHFLHFGICFLFHERVTNL